MTSQLRAALLVALLLLATTSGCDSARLPCPKLAPCNVAEATCQRKALEAAACLRGDATLPAVPVRVVSREAYVEEVRLRQLAASMGLPDERSAIINRAHALFDLAALDFAQAGEIEEQLRNVAAIYRQDAKEIVILSPAADVFLLVHEYVHALQDVAGHAPNAFGSTDAFLAHRALTEGEAFLIEHAAEAAASGFAAEDVNWQSNIARWGARSRQALLDSEDVDNDLYARFVYSHGARYLLPLWQRKRFLRVWPDEGSLPNNTRQILAGALAPVPLPEGWKQDLVGRAVPKLGPSYRLVSPDSLGQFVWNTFWTRLARSRRPGCRIVGPPPEIAADQFAIFHDPQTDEVIASWLVRVASVRGIPTPQGTDGHLLAQAHPLGMQAAAFPSCFAGRTNVVADALADEVSVVISDRATRKLDVQGWGPLSEVPPEQIGAQPDAGASVDAQ